MKLTASQQRKVNENMGLVGKVIADKVHDNGGYSMYSYDDLFQIGCIGLCKAAATDKGGCFSTYAYRLIWNEICDALIYSTRRQATEILIDDDHKEYSEPSEINIELKLDLYTTLEALKSNVTPTISKGIDALIMSSKGYTAREIGEQMSAEANLVTAWISKARKFLKTRPEIASLFPYGGSYEKA